MPNKEGEIKPVLRLLGSWITEIRLENAISFLDINKVSEGFARKLLNLIYQYDLQDLNEIQTNFPGLDLGELKGSKIAFQVTSRVDTEKVIDTLKKVVSNKHHETFTGGIKFLILREGEKLKFGKKTNPKVHLTTFDEENDLIYPECISREINKIYDADDFVTFLKIKELIERELRFITSEPPTLISDSINALNESLGKQVDSLKQDIHKNQVIDSALNLNDETQFPEIKTRGHRTIFVDSKILQLQSIPIMWITGSIGTGKTTLAYLIAKKIDIPKLWIDFRELDDNQLVGYLFNAFCNALNIRSVKDHKKIISEIISAFEIKPILVLNDLPDLSSAEKVQREVMYFLDQLTSNGFLILITSNYGPGLSIAEELGSKLKSEEIALFEEADTTEVLRSYGAPTIFEEESASLITHVAEGYPLVINTICNYLNQRNWNLTDENIDGIFKGDYSKDLNHQTYARILSSTEDDNTVDLLYRLKEISGSFSTKEIDAVSAISPVIKLPHHKITNLAGIWLQNAQNNHFQLSPLIKTIASNLTPELKVRINEGLAKNILSIGTISQFDALKAINYFIKGECYSDAAFTLITVLRKSFDLPNLFFNTGFNLVWFTTKIPAQVPAPLKFFIRFLQIQVCLESGKDYKFLFDDLESILKTEDVDQYSVGLFHVLSYRLTLMTEPLKSLDHLIESQKFLPIDLMSEKGLIPLDETFENAIWLTFCSIKSFEDYKLWFLKFEELSLATTVFDPETNHAYISAALSLYVNLIDLKSLVDLEYVLKTFHYIIDESLKKELYLLASYAIKNLVIVLCSDLKKVDEACLLIHTYKSLLAKHKIYEYLIIGELGHQYYLDEKYEDAERYLGSIIDFNVPDFYTEKVVFFRTYAKLTKDNHLAHRLIMSSLDAASNSSYYTLIEKLKLYGEAGISFLKINDLVNSIKYLEVGYDILHKSFEENDEFKSLVIRYGHTINYVGQILMDGKPPTKTLDGNYAVPVCGFFYFTNEKLIESGFYFEERRYLGALILKTTFEFLGNYELARKWALEAIQVTVNINEPKFAAVLNTCIFYLIKDKEFKKAYNVYLYIKQNHIRKGLDEKLEGQVNNLGNAIINVDDIVFYEHIFTPALYVLCLELLKQEISESEFNDHIQNLLDIEVLKLKDKETLLFIKSIFQETLINGKSVGNIYRHLEEYSGEYRGQVLTIGYLLLSSLSSAKDAASMQLSMILRVDSMFKQPFIGLYKFLILPFYEEFWKVKFDQCEQEFKEQSDWKKSGVPYFVNANDNAKLKKLFRTIVHHLDLNISTTIENWLT
jgi:chromosomal replication initiation ATPase DnaA